MVKESGNLKEKLFSGLNIEEKGIAQFLRFLGKINCME